MKRFTRPTAAVLQLLVSTFLTLPAVAQQRRQTPPKPQPKATAPPAPTFETLIPADSYKIYGEVRGVGQLIRSSSVTDILDPILKLASPPKEFKTLVRWMNTHADELMTSRLLVATWPTAKDVPEAIIAIEFGSPEEAAKFAKPLNEFLSKVLPPTAPQASPEVVVDKSTAGDNFTLTEQVVQLKPSYHSQQAGSLILLTPTPLTLKKLKPAGSKLLSEDLNFRAARNRFNSEPLFVFIDMKAIERQDAEHQKQFEQERRQAAEESKKAGEELEKEATVELTEAEIAEMERAEAEELARQQPSEIATLQVKEPPPPDPVSTTLTMLSSSFFTGESKWPEGIALALSFENDSFDVRALFVNQPGEKSDAVPFMSMLIPGQAFVPESPNILPADSELLVTISLDLPQIYSVMSKPRPNSKFITSKGNNTTVNEEVHESPFAAIEKKLHLNLKDDVLPLLGSELALRLPVKDFGIFGLPLATGQKPPDDKASVNGGPLLLISLKDKEGVRALMPRLVDALGFKGASSIAQTERRDDTEIVSYAGLFSYAFVGNFLVLSADPATTRYVVDSYLKGETLAGDSQFRNSTRWQPRPLHGQIYISSALMESYKTLAQPSNTRVSDETRAFLTRLSEVAQPITYSLSNEGLGPLHELHLPKNLVLMAVAGLSGESNPPPALVNERAAMGMLYHIASAERRYKDEKGNGSYGTLEQLIAEGIIRKEMLELSGYKLELTATSDTFQLSAVPLEYGKTGNMSYFIDHTLMLRGGDRNGAPATSSDPTINQ